MKRVVKPGGYLVISEMFSDNLNPAQEVQKLFHHTRSRIDRFLGIYHHDTWTRDEIINMVKNSGISILGTFDFKKRINLINNHNELEAWVLKMKQSIDRAKGYPFYESVLPVIDEFRVKAMKYGFQPATNVVIVGTK
jgi:hypothetical protein